MRKKMVVGNWKMNTTSSSAKELATQIRETAGPHLSAVDVVFCPPFPYLSLVSGVISGSQIGLGGQDVSARSPGAFTGENAAEMLLDVGCEWAIIGHSERRTYHAESDAVVNQKLKRAVQLGLSVFLCVGERKEERQSNQTEVVLETQLSGAFSEIDLSVVAKVVIAYEPVWAIGTGLVATNEQAESAHAFIRGWLKTRYNAEVADGMRILYGGSVKADNASGLLSQPNVDGALVGGASLDAHGFASIIQSAAQCSCC